MSSTFRAIRGAIQIAEDTREEVASATAEVVAEMLQRNGLTADDLVSVIFTATPDIHSAFPAQAAREMGMEHVPLLCAAELDIAGALPRVIRVMMHAMTTLSAREVTHVYLRGATVLRSDLA